jgi:DNA-directed RNA polymerase specialized sigma subunit
MTVATPKTKPRRGYLATPLDNDERRRVDRLYREHGGLVKSFGRKYCRKYAGLRAEDIYSCIDIAFIKTCRAWDATKGAFSTLLGVFSEGEIRHFIRDNNWEVKAPGAVRSLGSRARHMLRAGQRMADICTSLDTTPEALKLALFATQSLDHDVRGFTSHICTRPTPWEMLDADQTEN